MYPKWKLKLWAIIKVLRGKGVIYGFRFIGSPSESFELEKGQEDGGIYGCIFTGR